MPSEWARLTSVAARDERDVKGDDCEAGLLERGDGNGRSWLEGGRCEASSPPIESCSTQSKDGTIKFHTRIFMLEHLVQ